MPIDSDLKRYYPDDWEAIREEVLQRATRDPDDLDWGHELDEPTPCCEWCERPQGIAVIVDGDEWRFPGLLKTLSDESTRTTLTTAHLCQDPRCDNLDHLRALCQRCHLEYDQQPAQRERREQIKAEIRGQQTLGRPAGCEEVAS